MNTKVILNPAIIILILIAFSCGTTNNFKKDSKAFNTAQTITKYKAVADMNDAYFVIKENKFFEFYRELFDTVKNTSYPGKYIKSGDTLTLYFYNKKGYSLLGSKALINSDKKEIIFFDKMSSPVKKVSFN